MRLVSAQNGTISVTEDDWSNRVKLEVLLKFPEFSKVAIGLAGAISEKIIYYLDLLVMVILGDVF